MSTKSTIAVVPTYNAEHLISKRVKELLQSSFQMIVICDDQSSDGTPEVASAQTDERVAHVLGDRNVGPGGNRNRVLQIREDVDCDYLLFVDSDCRVIYEGDLADVVEESLEDPELGVVGFGILDRDGSPMKWNYGSLMHPVHEAADQKLELLMNQKLIAKEQFIIGARSRAESYRMVAEKQPKEVGWVAEGCFAIRASLFKKLGGFDEAMRFHEAHDLSARLRDLGYKTVFNPIDLVQHLEHDSRMSRRSEDEIAAKLHYFKKHWGMSQTVFRHLFDLE